MSEPTPQRPVPSPPRPAPVADGAAPEPPTAVPDGEAAADRFADLAQRPVGEHVAVFEDEHGRLQRELGTIDQL
ncbi:MAG: hypothetical protein JHC71_16195 [Blastococcus sp.]|nr:hypothetical protein [Blastococcus sp.]